MSVNSVNNDKVLLSPQDFICKNSDSVKCVNKVLSLSNKAKQADISLSPTIILPLLTNDNNVYKVRTLMDPGSGTNWIAKDLLNKIEFTIVGSEVLEVVTFDNIVKQKFQLVEIYF